MLGGVLGCVLGCVLGGGGSSNLIGRGARVEEPRPVRIGLLEPDLKKKGEDGV